MTLDLAKLRAETLALIDGTTPGPWDGVGLTVYDTCLDGVASCHTGADARLIAAAPTLAADTLRLLDEIERLTAEIERLRADREGRPALTPEELAEFRRAHPLDGLARVALAAWVNVRPDCLPEAMQAHNCPATMEAWARVADAARAALPKGDPA